MMHDAGDFLPMFREAPTLGAVSAALEMATRRLDFNHFSLVQRADRRGAPAVEMSNYPTGLVALAAASDTSANPIRAVAEKTATPFRWDEIPDLIALTKPQRAFIAAAAVHGIVKGFTVPVHVPGRASGWCSFAVARGRALPAAALPAAHYLATFAFDAVRRLNEPPRPANDDVPAPRLTPRQYDCIVLAAQGKSNWVAGRLLGLSADTVHKYIENAKRRYGVSTRTELVVRTLHDGQLSFGDILQ